MSEEKSDNVCVLKAGGDIKLLCTQAPIKGTGNLKTGSGIKVSSDKNGETLYTVKYIINLPPGIKRIIVV
jgi:hypothetical protein